MEKRVNYFNGDNSWLSESASTHWWVAAIIHKSYLITISLDQSPNKTFEEFW